MSRPILVGGVAGAVAPFLFLLGAIAISRLEEDFMERLGWEVWPSGLALGPHGWLQTANFAVFGVLTAVLALALAPLAAIGTRLALGAGRSPVDGSPG